MSELPDVPDVPTPISDPVTVRTGMWSSGPGDTSGFGLIERPILRNVRAQRPYGGWYDDVADRLAVVVPGLPTDNVVIDRGEITFIVSRDRLLEVASQFRDDPQLRFEACVSVSGVHYPEEVGAELHAVYHLLSYTHNRRVRLEVECAEQDPHIPSVVGVYPMADWHERETWDMFGIQFDGHPHLTRILMPDDWNGHPQRKDYPLGGVPVEYKGAVVPAPDNRRTYS